MQDTIRVGVYGAGRGAHLGSVAQKVGMDLVAVCDSFEPLIDVYKAIDMTSVGILGYRSALQGGIPLEVPDFRDKAVRERYRNDDWNPDPARRREGMPLPSVLGDIHVPEENIARFAELRRRHVEGLG